MADDSLSPGTKKFLACACILAAEILERVAFYAFLAGLCVFLNGVPTRWTEVNALNLTLVFLGVSYSTALIGSFLADVCIGRFWAIFFGFVAYLGGYIWWVFLIKFILEPEEENSFPAMCHPSTAPNKSIVDVVAGLQRMGPRVNFTNINVTAEWFGRGGMPSWSKEVCSWPTVLIVCVIGFGVGIVRTNLAPYGALHWTRWKRHNQNIAANENQGVLPREPPQHQAESGIVREFFSWFFWASSTGSLIAIGALAYVQIEINYMISAAIAAVGCLGMAFVIFFVGGLWYAPSTTPSRDPFLVCMRAACCWCCRRRQGYLDIRNESPHESIETVSRASNENARQQVEEELRAQQQQQQLQQQQEAERATDRRRFWYLAIISLVLIPYWIIYHQMLTTFPFQAVHMNIIVDGFYLPVPWMYLTEAIVIFIMIPLIHGVILPHMESRGTTISMRTRMAIGITFAILSIMAAGVLEIIRRKRSWETDGKIPIVIHNETFHAANMPVFWQVPQYFLMGIGDAFSNVAGLELIYSQTPENMRGMAIGIFWLFSGFGSFLSCALTVIGYHVWFFDWDDGNPNCEDCRVEYYFFIQAGLAIVCLVLFLILTSCCKIGLSHKYDRRAVGQAAPARVDGVAPNIDRSIL